MTRPNFKTALALVFVLGVSMSAVAVSARTHPQLFVSPAAKGDRLSPSDLAKGEPHLRAKLDTADIAADACLPACSTVVFKSTVVGQPSQLVHGVAMQ